MSRLESVWTTVGDVLRLIRREEVTFLAAAVAYYGFLSIIPLLLLAATLGSILGIDVSGAVLARVGDMVTPAGAAALENAIDASGPGSAISIVGVAVLVWSSLRVFRGLDVAFATIYGATESPSMLDQVTDALVVLVVTPFVVGAVAILSVALPVLDLGPLAWIAGPGTLWVTLSLAFVPLYYTIPDVSESVRNVLPGAAVAAVGWTILASVFGIYAQFVPGFRLYGVLGGALLLVTWLYLGGIIIMVGAVVNAVLAGRIDDGEDEAEDDEQGPAAQRPAPDVAALGEEVRELRESLEKKTVSKDDLERDLERYVRRRLRRGKARGWGPYLVLLYGTAMTLGAFYWLRGGWAIFAMIVVWLSTLGLYVLLVIFGVGFAAAGVPGSVLDWVRERRS